MKTLAQVKNQIVYKQQKIKALHRQIEVLIKRESQLIAAENPCKGFNPLPSEIYGHSRRCRDCGQFEQAHKGNEPTLSTQ